MKVLTLSQARSNFEELIDGVCVTQNPVMISGANDCHVVIMSVADYNGMLETMYLLSSPKNASRLIESIQHLRDRDVTAGRKTKQVI